MTPVGSDVEAIDTVQAYPVLGEDFLRGFSGAGFDVDLKCAYRSYRRPSDDHRIAALQPLHCLFALFDSKHFPWRATPHGIEPKLPLEIMGEHPTAVR